MKREADGDMGSPFKRSRRGDEEVRLLIPSKVAGSIIGKGGQTITKLRSKYKASVTVPNCPGPERLLSLSSDMDSCLNIIEDVVPHLKESRDNHGDELDLRMLIHKSQAGCVIGKSGSKIKDFREKFGVKIKIFSNCAPQSTDRIVQIIGEPQRCISTIREVLTLIKQSPIKGPVEPYDPDNFDEFYADEYGGWGGAQNRERDVSRNGPPMRGGRDDRRGPGGPGGRTGSGGGRFGGRGGDNFRSALASRPPPFGPSGLGGGVGGGFRDREEPFGGGFGRSALGGSKAGGRGLGGLGSFEENGSLGMPSSFNRPPPAFGLGGTAGAFSSGVPKAAAGLSPPLGGGGGLGGKNTTQVTIPKDLAGAIIGKGGGRIRKIRMDSGAGITIDEPLPGSNDRIITITGSANQIQMAQYLLQQSVHNNADRGSY